MIGGGGEVLARKPLAVRDGCIRREHYFFFYLICCLNNIIIRILCNENTDSY